MTLCGLSASNDKSQCGIVSCETFSALFRVMSSYASLASRYAQKTLGAEKGLTQFESESERESEACVFVGSVCV